MWMSQVKLHCAIRMDGNHIFKHWRQSRAIIGGPTAVQLVSAHFFIIENKTVFGIVPRCPFPCYCAVVPLWRQICRHFCCSWKTCWCFGCRWNMQCWDSPKNKAKAKDWFSEKIFGLFKLNLDSEQSLVLDSLNCHSFAKRYTNFRPKIDSNPPKQHIQFRQIIFHPNIN